MNNSTKFEDSANSTLECPAIFAPVKERDWNKERVWPEGRSTSQIEW